jgi:glutamate-ammonia-ligase adenylyltransferase
VFAASPYLAGLARRDAVRLPSILDADPDKRLAKILAATDAVAAEPDFETARRRLRELKADLHLLTALCDLGGVWDLDAVTGALTRFADASLRAALAQAVRLEVDRGSLTMAARRGGPAPGLFCIAMGKHGAFELNYSSDIDFSIFYAPERCRWPRASSRRAWRAHRQPPGPRPAGAHRRRLCLPHRPAPAARPVLDAAGHAGRRGPGILRDRRPELGAGGPHQGADLRRRHGRRASLPGRAAALHLARNLDFAAIADIHSIKRQIHAYKVDDRLTAKGADLKLGRGGIREIEFFVQTQQLILGGRNRPAQPRTLTPCWPCRRRAMSRPRTPAGCKPMPTCGRWSTAPR